jgi:NTP pyrophosphatase (non-canonical NTP hydrolase)
MTIEIAQQQVDEWIKTIGVRYFNELTNLGILMEEVGELSRLMVRKYGEQSFKETDKNKEFGDEMVDVLWVLICFTNQTGVNLTDALAKNFEKKIFVILIGTKTIKSYSNSFCNKHIQYSNLILCLFYLQNQLFL